MLTKLNDDLKDATYMFDTKIYNPDDLIAFDPKIEINTCVDILTKLVIIFNILQYFLIC